MRRSSNTAKSALRVEQARIAALAIVADNSAVNVPANRSAPTGPKAAANTEPWVSEERSNATIAISRIAPTTTAEVRRRVRPSLAPMRQPPKPPKKAATTEPEGAIVATSTLQPRPWIVDLPSSARAPTTPTDTG